MPHNGQNALNLSEIGLIAPTVSMTTTMIMALAYTTLFAVSPGIFLKKRDF
jgi:hypothetical protein